MSLAGEEHTVTHRWHGRDSSKNEIYEKLLNINFQLHLYYIYTAVVAKLFWCIFIFLSNMTRQRWDPAGFGSSSCSSYDAY